MKYTALWLEDNYADIPRFVESVCLQLNIEVVFAKSIRVAMEIARSKHIDLFLLDIEIANERITGIEYARQLRSSQRHHKTPILFVSCHSHLARHLFASVQNCQLLTKPYDVKQLEFVLGYALGIREYVQKTCDRISLLFPVKRETAIEVNTQAICYIEFLKNDNICIQLNNGKSMTLHCQRGGRKYILCQLEQKGISHLVQIYRSTIVNIHKIKSVKIEGREGYVYLFGDDVPKALGSRYRDNIKNFL